MAICVAISFYAINVAKDDATQPTPEFEPAQVTEVGSVSGDVSSAGETDPPETDNAPETTGDVSGDIVPRSPDMALLALVLDDCGGNLAMARRVVSLDVTLTWAILPKLRFSTETADLLKESEIPFLLHLPMQADPDPDGKAGDPMLYCIGVGMDAQSVRDAMTPVLDSLPGAWGVNNHRGSKATADIDLMRAVMDVLLERGLFFMDSRTTTKSVAYDAALEKGLKTARNSRFLDNESDRLKIASQMEYAVGAAKKYGKYIAICHLRPETVAFLEGLSTDVIAEKGVKLVTLPQLMEEEESEGE
ncbi:MAG: divergent polysaccharide deacetylase family protein [Synergistaceae bacterium]|nr:divergent polysaccharide deacetylase family protein [Synergistaceae bacterium]